MKINKLLTLAVIGAAIIALSACQTTRRTLNFDTSAYIEFQALNSVNPDSDNRASPVVVRMFKLADARQFRREDFLNLYENAEQRLGNDLLDTIVLKELAPGETRIEAIALTPETKYIGLLAEFVQYEDAKAIMVLPITDHKKNKFEVKLHHNVLTSEEAYEADEAKSEASSKADIDAMRREIYELKRDKDTLESLGSIGK